ncbi:RNA polymerase subunit sigma-70 [Flavipsychrobacter stenotrophus]|uniref:RNA polymerase subunit sigma-70 n=1 Tax=Flavipsychrobacter stenotrophus TaxID=2077091 RepID=A0A2S7T2C0_9BACT|nr:sigma-70 family RNA polymerase sigma factor [Flavipsychrobacter stenotrophus]PQJ13104.1 RNA polymerase subunit sigma-70 [Flavipsychrobacter stenotrophus]
MPRTEYSRYTESELVTFLKQKDRAVFDYLYNNYSAAIFSVIYKMVKDHHTSEDTLQDVFVKIWNKIDQYEASKGTLYTWMMNIAVNAAIDTLRSKGDTMKRKCKSNEHLSALPSQQSKPAETIGLSGLLLKLKPEHQTVMKMVYFQGYTTLEVANILNIPCSTIKSRVKRSLSLLRLCYA